MTLKRLLYIIANPNPADFSFGRKVGDFLVSTYKTQHPDHLVEVKDLYQEGVSLISSTYLNGRRKQATGESGSITEAERTEIQTVERTVDHFLSFDRYVLVVPMWNFGVPPLLKAYIDQILVPGKTFQYTAQGPIGLLAGSDRKMVIVESSGGIYSQGDLARLNHCSGYLKDVFSFIGVEQLKVIPVEGTALPGYQDSVVSKAQKAAEWALTEF
jgi:FMN-dependent NADH-azoreductase